jgi:hypothetical protein
LEHWTLLGNTADEPEIVLGAPELRSPERRKTWLGAFGVPISVVFGGTV